MSRPALSLAAASLMFGSVGVAIAGHYPTHTAFTDNPWAYDDAFIDAATRAVIRQATARDYYAALGPEARRQGRAAGFYRPCRADAVPRDYLANPGICRLARYVDDGASCANTNGCSSLVFDPVLLSDAQRRPVILGALADPCAQLAPVVQGSTSPPLRTFRPHGLAYSDAESWALFRCGTRKPVRPRLTSVNAATGAVTLSF